jgi:hypothetical protein
MSWPNPRQCPSISEKGLRKTTKNLRAAGLRTDIWTRDFPNTYMDQRPALGTRQWIFWCHKRRLEISWAAEWQLYKKALAVRLTSFKYVRFLQTFSIRNGRNFLISDDIISRVLCFGKVQNDLLLDGINCVRVTVSETKTYRQPFRRLSFTLCLLTEASIIPTISFASTVHYTNLWDLWSLLNCFYFIRPQTCLEPVAEAGISYVRSYRRHCAPSGFLNSYRVSPSFFLSAWFNSRTTGRIWKPHNSVHNSPPLDPVMRKLEPVHSLTHSFFTIHFNTVLPTHAGLPNCLFSQCFRQRLHIHTQNILIESYAY